jgi:hypothetical protein
MGKEMFYLNFNIMLLFTIKRLAFTVLTFYLIEGSKLISDFFSIGVT